MSITYGDSSALAKLYLQEIGSSWMRALAQPTPSHLLHTSELAALEVTSAIVRRARGGTITSAAANRALATLRRDWTAVFTVVSLTTAHIAEATRLVQQHGLRGYDAIHLAAALFLHRQRQAQGVPLLVFVSADQEQLRAAQAEGLATDDPNLHP